MISEIATVLAPQQRGYPLFGVGNPGNRSILLEYKNISCLVSTLRSMSVSLVKIKALINLAKIQYVCFFMMGANETIFAFKFSSRNHPGPHAIDTGAHKAQTSISVRVIPLSKSSGVIHFGLCLCNL